MGSSLKGNLGEKEKKWKGNGHHGQWHCYPQQNRAVHYCSHAQYSEGAPQASLTTLVVQMRWPTSKPWVSFPSNVFLVSLVIPPCFSSLMETKERKGNWAVDNPTFQRMILLYLWTYPSLLLCCAQCLTREEVGALWLNSLSIRKKSYFKHFPSNCSFDHSLTDFWFRWRC